MMLPLSSSTCSHNKPQYQGHQDLCKRLLVCCQPLGGKLLEHMVQHKVGAPDKQDLLLLLLLACIIAGQASQQVIEEAGPLLWEVKPCCFGYHQRDLHCYLQQGSQQQQQRCVMCRQPVVASAPCSLLARLMFLQFVSTHV
jgi:hypothetical protein